MKNLWYEKQLSSATVNSQIAFSLENVKSWFPF
jgi:hypothetical protein